MSQESHYRKLENMMHAAPIVKLTGAEVQIGEGSAEIVLPVKKEFFHTGGALHGALYFLALDNAAFFASNSMVMDVAVLTKNFTIYFKRPVSKGIVRAVGKVVNFDSSQFNAESILCDSEKREIARGSGVFVRSNILLSEKIGYK